MTSCPKRRRNGMVGRYYSLRESVEGLSRLRQQIALPPESDISEQQWAAIEQKLKASEEALLVHLHKETRRTWSERSPRHIDIEYNAFLADIQTRLPKAYAFFDTYLDVLTQRHMPEIGKLLGGCDALAWDAINRDHPALRIIVPPLVYFDRGFGASTIREGVSMPDSTPNPLPLIQIPYTKLFEKYNLTSILHEAGHEAMVRLGLKKTLPAAIHQALDKVGATDDMKNYYGLWMSEIGPDFWTFCNAGLAAAGGIREILALPYSTAFSLSWSRPHPPPYLRVLLNFEWCRQAWGHGPWDEWKQEWKCLYPENKMPEKTKDMLIQACQFIPLVSRTLLTTRFRVLDKKSIPELFDLGELTPARLENTAKQITENKLNLKNLRPCAHLAIFRLIKEKGYLDEGQLDKLMTKWLAKLKETATN